MNRRNFIKTMLAGVAIACTNPVEFVKLIHKDGIRSTYAKMKRKVLLQHSLEIERAFLYGVGKDAEMPSFLSIRHMKRDNYTRIIRTAKRK